MLYILTIIRDHVNFFNEQFVVLIHLIKCLDKIIKMTNKSTIFILLIRNVGQYACLLRSQNVIK